MYATNNKDQAYTYDGLQRLKDYESGTLSGTSISGLAATGQTWFLDQLGNWTYYQQFVDTGVVLAQERAHNDVNEIDTNNDHSDGPGDAITRDTGPNWADPVYDAAGNMTTMPQPLAPTSSYTLQYDAWNRLVEVSDTSGTVQTNEFDGLNRRIVRDETGGSGDKIHYYYNQQWQVLEERKEVSSTIDPDPLAQYVYHPDYVDAIAVRFYDENTDGDLLDANEGAHYYLQDANFNVTAVTDDTGTVVERYAYTPYGEVTILDASFVKRSPHESDIDNEYLYTGRRRDPETGLQLNRNRFYASNLGRWVNRDPIGYADGYNLYEYVGASPTDRVDPDGTACTKVGNITAPSGGAMAIGGTGSFNNVGTNPGVFNAKPTSTVICLEAFKVLERWKCKCCYNGKTTTITNTVWATNARLFSVPVPRSKGSSLMVVGVEVPIPGILGSLGTNIGIYAFYGADDRERANNICKDNAGKGTTLISNTTRNTPTCP